MILLTRQDDSFFRNYLFEAVVDMDELEENETAERFHQILAHELILDKIFFVKNKGKVIGLITMVKEFGLEIYRLERIPNCYGENRLICYQNLVTEFPNSYVQVEKNDHEAFRILKNLHHHPIDIISQYKDTDGVSFVYDALDGIHTTGNPSSFIAEMENKVFPDCDSFCLGEVDFKMMSGDETLERFSSKIWGFHYRFWQNSNGNMPVVGFNHFSGLHVQASDDMPYYFCAIYKDQVIGYIHYHKEKIYGCDKFSPQEKFMEVAVPYKGKGIEELLKIVFERGHLETGDFK